MHLRAMVLAGAIAVAPPAMAQTPGSQSPPAEIGNRANGLSYQPTPGEVDAREAAKSVRPPAAEQRATDRELEELDKKLLLEEGLGTGSVPKIPARE